MSAKHTLWKGLLLACFVLTGCENVNNLANPDDTGAIPRPAPDITVIAGNARLEIRWTKAVTATGYEAYYHTVNDPEAARRWLLIDVNETNLVKAVITGLENGTGYYVWVKAIYPHGISDFSEAAGATPAPPPSWAAPISPAVIPGDETLELSWEAAENATALDPQRDYRIATSSYLYDGGDGYWMFYEQGKSVKQTGIPISIVVIDYIYAQDLPLVPQTDGRVTLIGGAVQ
jgi:hypothetical protein